MLKKVFLGKPDPGSGYDTFLGLVETVPLPGAQVVAGNPILEFEWLGGLSNMLVNSPYSGVITAIHVKAGEEIKSGDLLLEIDDGK